MTPTITPKVRATLSWLFLAAASTARAESLTEAWSVALREDPALAAANAEAQSALSRERAARGGRWPSISGGGSYVRYADAPALEVITPGFSFTSPRIFDNDDTVTGSVDVRLPLNAGGSLMAGIRAAGAEVRAAAAERERSTADLKLDVARNYLNVLRSQRTLASADASIRQLASHLADVQIMVNRESVARSDLLAARVALANAEQYQLRAVHGLALAWAAYNRRLGQPLDRRVELDERIDSPMSTDEVKLEAVIASAVRKRSELIGLDARADALMAQARSEAGRQLPQIALTGNYTHLESTILDRRDFSAVGVGFTWTLFDGGQIRQRASALRRASEAARLRAADMKSSIELEVRDAWLARDEARARIQATREAVEQAEENLRMSRELYGAGLATNTQVLEAVTLRITAAGNRDAALLDAELARIALARAAGEL
jgi:outer membrane protein TolC